MMRATNLLLTVLAVASVAAAGCGGDDGGKKGDTTSTTADVTSADGDTTVSTQTDTTTNPDTEGPDCASICAAPRECGTRLGCNCGTCDPGQTCDTVTNTCEEPGKPMGSFCGITATCTPTSPTYPDCLDDQCAQKNCLSNNGSAFILRDVCSSGCNITKDEDGNGVNDPDAPGDTCNPPDIVDGPAGNLFRCVNYAAADANPVGLCTPGSEFEECEGDDDCPDGEGCELTTIGGDISQRCVAKYRENASWDAKVSNFAEECNDDPEAGERAYCGSGLCFGLGCVTLCNEDSDCDTTTVFANTGCNTQAGTCNGNSSKACTNDIDCSGWECGDPRQIFSDGQGGLTGPELTLCWPKDCVTDAQCGGGFYCRFFWNGEAGDDAALDNSCLLQTEGGAELGEECDSNPDDNIPGATCKNADLCIGGFCSQLCETDNDCKVSAGQVCAVAELPGDADEDGEDDFVLPVKWCQTYPGSTSDCLFDSDCAATESCQVFEVENPDANGRSVSPFILAGKCQTIDTAVFPGEQGKWGDTCASGSACRSGFCLGATAEQDGFCTKTCADSTECEPFDAGGETANGLCQSLLYGYGGDIDDGTNVVYIPLCVPTGDSLEDCTGDFACTDENDICIFNVVATDATREPTIEYLCAAVVAEGPLPTGAIGSACNPNPAEDDPTECANGYCIEDKDGNGYCSAPCATQADCGTGNGTTCTQSTVYARLGIYAENSGEVGLCRKPSACEQCSGNFDCTGDNVCTNLGTNANPNFRCVEQCDVVGDCTDNGDAFACNPTTDEFGQTSNGCYNKNGNANVNHCAQ